MVQRPCSFFINNTLHDLNNMKYYRIYCFISVYLTPLKNVHLQWQAWWVENETLSYEVNITSITYVCINLPTDFPISATIIVQYVITVSVIWNCHYSTVLGHFVTENSCLHELWTLLSFEICPHASLTHRLWEI